MLDGTSADDSVSTKSQISKDSERNNCEVYSPGRRTSLISVRSQVSSPSPTPGLKIPLTPKESPSAITAKKRSTSTVEQEDKDLNSANTAAAHSRIRSAEGFRVCICQPDPKIPRPRNAFILYRQHHQARVVARHPGLSNPQVSKILGKQWQNQPTEVKDKWKVLAEEEKLRHQHQYPTYRYQPKRNARRDSLSDPPDSEKEIQNCPKCGGRSILTSPVTHTSSPYPDGPIPTAFVPPTPDSALTPVSKTLPRLTSLNLQSPAAWSAGGNSSNTMPDQSAHLEDRDDVGSLSPVNKRRRFENDHPALIPRTIPPRYGNLPPPGAPVGPGTPFPFGPGQSHPYSSAVAQYRRESLPGLRGTIGEPSPMAPPPRHRMGYQQHRVSQGRGVHDRSLTLAPLQTISNNGAVGVAPPPSTAKSTEDHVMSMPFRYKIKILRQVAPPARLTKNALRGPFVAVEGDDADAVRDVGQWLHDELNKSEDLSVTLVEGPDVAAAVESKKPMVQYHLLVADWLEKSERIIDSVNYRPTKDPVDSASSDAPRSEERARSIRDIRAKDDNNNSLRSNDQTTESTATAPGPHASPAADHTNDDQAPTVSATASAPPPSGPKPVSIVANYSLHASNTFACRIPITADDPYAPNDHWQWTATQWRGVAGPDLTVFVQDGAAGESGKSGVEISEDGELFVVKRSGGGERKLEPSVLRRLGFEVGEWVRAFGPARSHSA